MVVEGAFTQKLWLRRGRLIGLDFSDEMLKGEANNCKNIQNATFLRGDAYQTNLPANLMLRTGRSILHELTDEELRELIS
ncbi:hypothetical protein J2TS4_25460 [Paenibacillus sp. J2TS4]|nr:hypothetical protein J2TS4_25460 [Paenibacillus sp. J2TS4]